MSNASVKEIQQALIDAGFPVGPLDGIWGRRSMAALKLFQQANGLTPDGICGPLTYAKLRPGQPMAAMPVPWYHEALRLKGLREVPGKANSPVILQWAEDVDLEKVYTSDSIAWCGLFCSHCIASTLTEEVLPVNPLGARNWLSFGRNCTPRIGAVLVFWRNQKNSWSGHVGFYAGEDRDSYHVLGGNQSDKVCISRISKSRLLGARWPATASAPGLGEPSVQEDIAEVLQQPLSENEQ